MDLDEDRASYLECLEAVRDFMPELFESSAQLANLPEEIATALFRAFDGFFVVVEANEVGGLKVKYASSNAGEIVTQDEIVGKSLFDLCKSENDRNKLTKNLLGRSAGDRVYFSLRMNLRDNWDFDYMDVMGVFQEDGEFYGLIRVVPDRPIMELSLAESMQDEYMTRHALDGTIVYADQRISHILGYLPSEVLGKSAYNFIKGDDLPYCTMANRMMYASDDGQGHSTQRLRRKDGGYATVQTSGYLEVSPDTKKVESFFCINKLIMDEAEVKRQLSEQERRFLPYIAEYKKRYMTPKSSSPASDGSPGSEASTSRGVKHQIVDGKRYVEAVEEEPKFDSTHFNRLLDMLNEPLTLT